jgi:VanZ family protein
MTEYGVLTLLFWRARNGPVKNDPRRWCWKGAAFAFGAAALYAVTDEFHQSFVSTRQGQWTDVLIDVTGALLALTLLWSWGRWQDRW